MKEEKGTDDRIIEDAVEKIGMRYRNDERGMFEERLSCSALT